MSSIIHTLLKYALGIKGDPSLDCHSRNILGLKGKIKE